MRIILLLAITITFNLLQAQQAQNLSLAFNWHDPSIPGSFAYDNAYNECWGYEVNGAEIAIIGTSMGTHFFDVSDINNVVEVDFVEGKATGGQIIHRDYHDYAGYLYMVSDEGASSLQIVDLSYLPDSVHVVYDSDALMRRVHNIFIDTASAHLYACAITGSSFSAMQIFSLANPLNPVLVYDLASSGQIGHVHDAYVENGVAYLNCGYDGLYIYDVSTPTSPSQLGSLTSYPGAGYNHSGWLHADGMHYIMADETHGSQLKMLDVSDLNNIQVVSTFGLVDANNPNAIAHNQLVKGDTLYCSYYYDGIRMFDISDPANPTEVAWYDTYDDSNGVSYKGAWGTFPYFDNKLIVSDMQTGLYVFEESAAVVASFDHNAVYLTVQFNDMSANAISWDWDFGDGNSSTLQHPSHSYAAAGNYDVCLYASDGSSTDTFCAMITVQAQIPPIAGFTYVIDSVNLSVNFTDTSANSPNSWLWSFGDGNGSNLQNPIHSYGSEGSYTVCLTAVNGDGSDSACTEINIVMTDTTQDTTAIELNSRHNILVYPTAFVNDITIEGITTEELNNIYLLNVIGKRIDVEYTANPKSVELKLQDQISSGYYFLKLDLRSGQSVSFKLYKE